MPVKFPERLTEFQKSILNRFWRDVENLSNDINSQVTEIIDVGRTQGIDYVITKTEEIFDQNERRIELMGDSLVWQSTQLGAFQNLFMEKDTVRWNLDPSAEHCADCLEYASIGEFTLETLPGIPGEADTECDGGCKCFLT